jgi:hypothetical protein
MNLITLTRTVLALLPIVIEAIKLVEAAIPGEGQGEKKLAMVRVMLESTMSVSGNTVVEIEKVWTALQPVIAFLVKNLLKK